VQNEFDLQALLIRPYPTSSRQITLSAEGNYIRPREMIQKSRPSIDLIKPLVYTQTKANARNEM